MRSVVASPLVIALLFGAAYAEPLKPMAKGTFDGIPLDQAMSTMRVLGKWILPKHGTIQVFTMAGVTQKGCLGAETDPDQCTSARLYVAAEDALTETHGLTTQFYPETYLLLRGVNGTGWYLPDAETLKFITPDRFSLLVCGTKFTTELSGGAIVPTKYMLRITRHAETGGRFLFSATMEKQDTPGFEEACGADHMMDRDENFHVVPRLQKPGPAPR
jgi:hypothetical protein